MNAQPKPNAVDALNIRTQAKAIIGNPQLWNISGKIASVTLPNGTAEHDAVAVEVRKQLQRYVTGFTPRMDKTGDNFIITTKAAYLAEAQKALAARGQE